MQFYSNSDVELMQEILTSFRRFREEGLLCDVVLEAQTDQGAVQKISAHRVVLASRSSYFKTIFAGDMSESTRKSVFVEDVDTDVLQAVVSYAYDEDFTLPEDRVIGLLAAADMFQILPLCRKCCLFLIDNLRPERCLGVRDFPRYYGFEDLYEACMNYARSNFESVTSHSEYLFLPPDEFKHLISSDKVCVNSEELVYAAVVKWVYYDLEERESEFSAIMSCVRLPFVSSEFLSETVGKEPLVLNDNQCIKYLQEAHFYKTAREKCTLLEDTPRFKPRKLPGIDDNMLITVGGMFEDIFDGTFMEKYHPETNDWTILEEIEWPKFGLSACYYNGYIYTLGGFINEITSYSNNVERYSIKEQKWESMMPMKEYRMCHSACILYGLIYITGGENSEGVLSSMECYNPDSNTWVNLAAMNSCRSQHGMTDKNGYLFVAGGRAANSILCSVEFYKPSEDIWTLVSSMSIPRYGLGLATLGGTIYAVGGRDDKSCTDSVESYDQDNDKWDEAVPLNIPRSGLGLVKYDDTLYACGGTDNGVLNCVEKYNSSSESWKLCASMNFSKSLFGIVSVYYN